MRFRLTGIRKRHNASYAMPDGHVLVVALAVLALACGHRRTEVADAGTDGGGTGIFTDGGGIADAGPLPDGGPISVPEARLYVLTDAGAVDGGSDRTPVTPDASIPDSAVLQFAAPAELRDFRVRILDAEDRLVPTHANLRVEDGWTTATDCMSRGASRI